jgi:hypothetical protein
MLAPLAAMDRLGDAPGEMNDSLLRQVAKSSADTLVGPSGRIDVRPDAAAAPLARRDLCDLDGPDAHRWREVWQPLGIAERQHGGNVVARLMMGYCWNKLW